jgi:hypothetical protein
LTYAEAAHSATDAATPYLDDAGVVLRDVGVGPDWHKRATTAISSAQLIGFRRTADTPSGIVA